MTCKSADLIKADISTRQFLSDSELRAKARRQEDALKLRLPVRQSSRINKGIEPKRLGFETPPAKKKRKLTSSSKQPTSTIKMPETEVVSTAAVPSNEPEVSAVENGVPVSQVGPSNDVNSNADSQDKVDAAVTVLKGSKALSITSNSSLKQKKQKKLDQIRERIGLRKEQAKLMKAKEQAALEYKREQAKALLDKELLEIAYREAQAKMEMKEREAEINERLASVKDEIEITQAVHDMQNITDSDEDMDFSDDGHDDLLNDDVNYREQNALPKSPIQLVNTQVNKQAEELNANLNANAPIFHSNNIEKEVRNRVSFPTFNHVLQSTTIERNSNQHERQPVQAVSSTAAPNPQIMETTFSQADLTTAIVTAIETHNNLSRSHKNRQDSTLIARQGKGNILSSFYGAVKEWPLFIASYRQTTKNCGYTQAENMERLKDCLRGAARESVHHLFTAPENVDRIIQNLESRYGRPELIIEDLTEQTRKLNIIKEGDFNQILLYADKVIALVTTIRNMQQAEYLTNPTLLRELVEKLPPSKQEQWALHQSTRNGLPRLNEYADWLEVIANTIRPLVRTKIQQQVEFKADRNRQDGDRRHHFHKGREPFHNGRGHVHAVHQRGGRAHREAGPRERQGLEKVCGFCTKTGHMIAQCTEYLKGDITDRRKWLSDNWKCFICLRAGHNAKNCRQSKKCGIEGCERTHHPTIHFPKDVGNRKANVEQACHVNDTDKDSGLTSALLKVLPVRLYGPAGEIKTYALLDEGATVTLLEADIAKKLGLSGQKTRFHFQGVGGHEQIVEDSEVVQLQVSSNQGGPKYFLIGVKTVKELRIPGQTIPHKILTKWQGCTDISLEELKGAKPTILIGGDHVQLIVSTHVKFTSPNAPVLSRTKLGWVLHGGRSVKTGQINLVYHAHHSSRECQEIADINQMMKEQAKIESFGVKVLDLEPRSRDDRKAEEVLKTTTRKLKDRYETGLLWRPDVGALPESKKQCFVRLQHTERKMDKSQDYAKLYTDKIEEYIAKGYIRKLTTEEAKSQDPKIWYLPHFGVVNPNKPGKFRLVFDFASKSHGSYLNDYLYQGPDLLRPLPSVLFCFRRDKIGFTGDIAEMFHMVRIRDVDLPSQRLLWRGMDRHREPDVYVLVVMAFGAACSPASAQYVKNLNAYVHREEFPEAAAAIIDGHYVDDYPDSANSVDGCTPKSTICELPEEGFKGL